MTTDTLAPYTRTETSYGPTATKTVTIRFEQLLRGALGRINAKIRNGIGRDDIFGLREVDDTLAVDDPPQLQTDERPAKVAQFIAWLREQLNSEVLEVVSRNENQFIRSAYAQGIRTATSQLRERGVDPATVDIEEIVNQGNFRRGLQVLFTRTFEELQDVTDEIISSVRDELLEGFNAGENPRTIARNITDRVNSIGKHRATLIARTEIINAYSEGTLRRYEDVAEQEGVDIGVRHVGRLTAQDEDVCAFCRLTANDVFTIDEFRDTTVQFRGTVYRLAPPSHPNGRCAIVPELGVTQDDLEPLSERVPGQLVTT